jgi:tetratricopeptide (TPR) repeat protein
MTRTRGVLLVATLLLLGTGTAQRTPPSVVREDAYRENNIGVARLERYDFAAAATSFRRALEIDRGLAIARLNLALALHYGGKIDAAQPEAAAAAEAMPDSPQAQYVLGLVARAAGRGEQASVQFRRVLALDPGDVGSRVQLAQILLDEQQYAQAIELFDAALGLEAFNATAAYGLAMALTRSGDRERGAQALQRFEQLRNNPAAITYSSAYLEQGRYGEAVASTGLEPELVDRSIPPVSFSDATRDLLGGTVNARAIALFDADVDGDLDLMFLAANRVRIRSNVRGRLTLQAADVTVGGAGNLDAAVAGDYDNDGLPDLFVLSANGGALLHQATRGAWRVATGLPPIRATSTAAWADLDHDGDLDIVTGAPQLLRNNGNRSFTDATAQARLTEVPPAAAIVPTDYDNRRDIDVLFVSAQGSPALMANVRDSTFRDVASDARLAGEDRYGAIAAGDVNKDGVTDFFFTRVGAVGRFAMSDGVGRFTLVDGPPATADGTAPLFLDYDNDGILDVLVATARGPILLRQVAGEWMDVTARALSAVLGVEGDPPMSLSAGDLDGDGDTDVVARLFSGQVRAWRNDGGNQHASLKVRLAPRVSNRSAAGAKVDVRAGSLRQRIEAIVATPPVAPADLLFGLGARRAADAVRVLWPAGILQAETDLMPRAVTITELNRKPSSCPFLYTWNGSRFEFVTDFMGGGEMGSWAGPGEWNVPDPDEYVRIRGDQLRERNGRYELRVTNELEEAVFVDRLHLIAVAHPAGTDVYPNEGLRSPAARQSFVITTVQAPRPPLRVIDHHGHDVSDRATAIDRRFVDDFKRERIQGYAEEHWVTIDLGVNDNDLRAVLLLTGWTDYAFSSDNVAASQAGLPFVLPLLQVKHASGKWATAMPEIGLPVGRPQTVVVDVSPLVKRGVREVRIVTTLRVYWDQILVDTSAPVRSSVHNVEPSSAVLRWRGFSAETSPDAAEPFGYDYARVSQTSPWKLMPGRYTREGDVRPLLTAVDDRFVIAAPGDEIALSFDSTDVPRPPPGWTTTFFLFVDGFSKEMNLRSGSPDRLEPLPFHRMRRYPYDPPEHYPDSPEYQEYRATYNTRVIAARRSR